MAFEDFMASRDQDRSLFAFPSHTGANVDKEQELTLSSVVAVSSVAATVTVRQDSATPGSALISTIKTEHDFLEWFLIN